MKQENIIAKTVVETGETFYMVEITDENKTIFEIYFEDERITRLNYSSLTRNGLLAEAFKIYASHLIAHFTED